MLCHPAYVQHTRWRNAQTGTAAKRSVVEGTFLAVKPFAYAGYDANPPAQQAYAQKERTMHDTSVTKINSHYSPKGASGQTYLASGIHIAMRMWEEAPGEPK